MKPVLVLQHLNADGPALLGRWLTQAGIRRVVRNNEAGEPFPDDIGEFSALALLGGEMSANDDLPSLRRAERLILQAFERDIPVLGHCLGGQLMAKALGARVVDSPAPEVGWQAITVDDSPAAAAWFGDPGPRTVFQWHFEAFELPEGAERVATSAACVNQAFAIGPHLAMQFHIEIDAEKLGRWSLDEGQRYRDVQAVATVQDGAGMRAGIPHQLPAHQVLAERIYRRWLAGLGDSSRDPGI